MASSAAKQGQVLHSNCYCSQLVLKLRPSLPMRLVQIPDAESDESCSMSTKFSCQIDLPPEVLHWMVLCSTLNRFCGLVLHDHDSLCWSAAGS